MAVCWAVFFRLPYVEVSNFYNKNTRQNNPNNLIVLVMALSDLKSLVEWKELCVRYRYDITRFSIEALGMTPTWQQELLFRSIARDGSRTSVASGHGCFGIDTPIMLADGAVKSVQDVVVGDKLMGDDGASIRNVLELRRGRENMYRFTYADNTSHIFNESHILCLVRDGEYFTPTVRDYLFSLDFHKYEGMTPYRLLDGQYIDLPIQSIEPLGEGDYYGFVLDGNQQFLGGDFTVLHNTGKSRSAGVVALWHLLFHEDSITLFTAPSITQLREIVWKEISICLNLLRTHNLGWLADYVAIFAEKIYIKGYDKSWHVIAKTASKHKPESIAGQHGDNYLLWGDEASGIDDKIYDVALGALSHKDNRCVLTSQPTRNAGFFYETHHRLSHRNGGAWTSLTFNGEQSPIVSDEMLLEMLEKYGSRDDAGYMIRVRGLFPDLSNEFLVTRTQLDGCYVGDSLLTGQHDDFGYVITVDVGGGVGRDDSTIAVSKVWGYANHGTDARRAEVVDIPLCKNKDTVHEIMGIIDECLVTYPNATLVVDDNGAGLLLGQELRARGMFYKSAKWGGQCFSNENRKDYFNKRSQANVCLSRAIAQGRFKIKTTKHKAKIQEQVTRIPYTFDEHARFKVLSKEEMLKRSIRSPDIADVFAYLFLEGVAYSEAYSDGFMVQDSDMQDNWQMLEQQAQEL